MSGGKVVTEVKGAPVSADAKGAAAETEKKKGIPGSVLKLIAIITMFIDHAAAVLIEMGYFKVNEAAAENNTGVIVLDFVMRAIGRIAFPIFCFLLVEGYVHTRSKWKYLRNLIIFGLISEVPFDLAFQGDPLVLTYNNVYFNLMFSLLMMMCWDKITKGSFKESGVATRIMAISMVIVIAALATVTFTDYYCFGPLLVFFMFIFRGKKLPMFLSGLVVLFITGITELFALVDYALFFNYNGQRGRQRKMLFYLFYPVHLSILVLIRYLIFRV